jgi:hypothetical protein
LQLVFSFSGCRVEEEVAGKNIVVEGQEVEEVSFHTELGVVEDLEEEAAVHTLMVVLEEGVDSMKEEGEVEELEVVSPSATLWQRGQKTTHQSTSFRETCSRMFHGDSS